MSIERPSMSRFAPAALRWGVAALVVVSVHGAAGWVIANWQRAEAAPGAPPAAVMIELAPLPVAPEAPPQDVAPGPEMVEAQPEPEPPTPEPVIEKEPDPVEPPPEPEPVKLPEPEIKIPELPSLPDAAAVLAPPPEPKPPEQKPPEVKPKPKPKPRIVERPKPIRPDKPKAEQTTAPTAQEQVAARAAAPNAGASSASPAAQASWRGSLMAHLNRFKRFPDGATPGTVQVAFSIDRGGRVLSARLVNGSGDAALDQEAVAMIRRANPVPAPPESFGGSAISLTVPIRFSR